VSLPLDTLSLCVPAPSGYIPDSGVVVTTLVLQVQGWGQAREQVGVWMPVWLCRGAVGRTVAGGARVRRGAW
jgi:hypothetical protein